MNAKERLLNHLKNAKANIDKERFYANGLIGQDFRLKITYGDIAYTKLISNADRIEGITSYRGGDGIVYDIPPERYRLAWGLCPQDLKDQLTESFTKCPDIQVRVEHTIYYKGSKVGLRLDQGLDSRGFSFPSDLKGGGSFKDPLLAAKAAIKLKDYINSMKNKKGNRNFGK